MPWEIQDIFEDNTSYSDLEDDEEEDTESESDESDDDFWITHNNVFRFWVLLWNFLSRF